MGDPPWDLRTVPRPPPENKNACAVHHHTGIRFVFRVVSAETALRSPCSGLGSRREDRYTWATPSAGSMQSRQWAASGCGLCGWLCIMVSSISVPLATRPGPSPDGGWGQKGQGQAIKQEKHCPRTLLRAPCPGRVRQGAPSFMRRKPLPGFVGDGGFRFPPHHRRGYTPPGHARRLFFWVRIHCVCIRKLHGACHLRLKG
ncbi:hypothetical protein MSL71_8310 [Desulfoluna butyratoxydans]|uniref:Uncharacterized protein n=1 Tax=Desulfoluna butyratoxydans TaxID=231438 RepID=A0A4U8YPN3_9BACT|nr:hypothetical protein MSL71_8310 [Desulfoluna butyratoxydans]